MDGGYACWRLRRGSDVLFLNRIEQGAADQTATYTCRRGCCDIRQVVGASGTCIPDELESKNLVLRRLHQSELPSQKSYKHASTPYMVVLMSIAYDMNGVVWTALVIENEALKHRLSESYFCPRLDFGPSRRLILRANHD